MLPMRLPGLSFGLMDASSASAWLWGQALPLFWLRVIAGMESQVRIIYRDVNP